MTIEGDTSNKSIIIMAVVGVLLIGGAIHSSYLASKSRERQQEEQGCAYYAKHTIDQVPVACYDFYKRNNHWNPDNEDIKS